MLTIAPLKSIKVDQLDSLYFDPRRIRCSQPTNHLNVMTVHSTHETPLPARCRASVAQRSGTSVQHQAI